MKRITRTQLRSLLAEAGKKSKQASNPSDKLSVMGDLFYTLDEALRDIQYAQQLRGVPMALYELDEARKIISKLRREALSHKRALEHQNVKQKGHRT